MELKSLHDLLIHELKDIYSAEKQLTKALPKMAKAASNEQLKEAFKVHLEETKGQIERLEQIFKDLGKSPRGETCKAMEGLIEEGDSLMKEKAADPDVMDAGLIAAAQRVEHYEIAAYGCARTYAKLLKNKEMQKLLQTTLNEEGATDKKLTKLAESTINISAASSE